MTIDDVVYLLGQVGFEDSQRLQRRPVYEAGESERAYLVLCEHAPLISIGRSGSRQHIRPDDDELKSMGLEQRWVNRGGGCVLHLPGQLVGYFALPFERLGIDVKGVVEGDARFAGELARRIRPSWSARTWLAWSISG